MGLTNFLRFCIPGNSIFYFTTWQKSTGSRIKTCKSQGKRKNRKPIFSILPVTKFVVDGSLNTTKKQLLIWVSGRICGLCPPWPCGNVSTKFYLKMPFLRNKLTKEGPDMKLGNTAGNGVL